MVTTKFLHSLPPLLFLVEQMGGGGCFVTIFVGVRKNNKNGKDMKREGSEKKRGVSLVACFRGQLGRGNSFTVANYRNAMQSVRRFLGKEAETFEVRAVSREWLLQYIFYMKHTDGLSAGSASCYLRLLRAVYNKALRAGAVREKEVSPFKGVRIVVPATLKRALSVFEMRRLKEIDLSGDARLCFVRDLFMFLFYARGMCFVDVFDLKYSDVSGGYIRYVRSKTKVPLNVKIGQEMQVLMDRYREAGNPYVFPSLRRNCYDTERQVSEPTACRRINRQLNILGEMIGFGQPLTVYVARHTWASLAEESGMNISFISQGLGHSSEHITHIYMKGIPSAKMDEANEEMLDKMLREGKIGEKLKDNERGKDRCPILFKNETSIITIKVYLMINIDYMPANV